MKIYLDMDGVIADFFGGIEEYFNVPHWKKIPKTEESILSLKGTDFFNTLRPYETSTELVDFVKSLTNDWGICSSPLRGDRDNSAFWKRTWLTKYGYMPSIDNLIFTGQKEHYAVNKFDGSPNILVDDKPDNIARWIAKGGIGIRYQANEDSITTIKRKLQFAIKEMEIDNV